MSKIKGLIKTEKLEEIKAIYLRHIESLTKEIPSDALMRGTAERKLTENRLIVDLCNNGIQANEFLKQLEMDGILEFFYGEIEPK